MNVQRRTLSQHPAALSYIHTCMELSHSVVESVKPECRFSLKVYVDRDLELHQKSTSQSALIGLLVCLKQLYQVRPLRETVFVLISDFPNITVNESLIPSTQEKTQ